MKKWFGRGRLVKVLCIVVPTTLLLAGCNTGFDPGMVAGGRCMSTAYAPGTANYFEYKPDCPSFSGGGFAPNHWTYVVFKDGYPDDSSLQQGAIGLTDNTTNPATKRGNMSSPFQTTWSSDGKGYDVEMHVKPGAVNQRGGHIDFNLVNQATDGVVGLHSHHEIFMKGHSGTYQTSYVLYFTPGGWAGATHYSLTYVIAHNLPGMKGAPPGVLWYDDVRNGQSETYHAALDASHFQSFDISKGWTTIDIDWTSLIQYAINTGLFGGSDILHTHGTQVGESYYASVFGPKGTALGGIDTVQRNWVMHYDN